MFLFVCRPEYVDYVFVYVCIYIYEYEVRGGIAAADWTAR